MYAISMLCMGMQAIVSVVVGVRLAMMARRTRRFPELALSLAMLLGPAIGYPAVLLALGLERAAMPGVAPVFFFAVSVVLVAVAMNYYFTWRVFRPDAVWAVVLCAFGTWLLIAPVGGLTEHVAASGVDTGIRNARVWSLTVVFSVLVGYGWTGIESFRFFLTSRLRLRLGLVEPAVCNRFLLWSLSSWAYWSMGSMAGGVLLLGLNPLSHDPFTLSLSAASLVNSVCMVLCFMPPQRYVAWLERRNAAVRGA